ncbi:MAG: hypothetical protein HUJ65_02130, partial [Oscillospiraceae bacterium]|nr:hypothetical protein [Oscillospiraceae bacterium]
MNRYGCDGYEAYIAIRHLNTAGENPEVSIKAAPMAWTRYLADRYERHMDTGVMEPLPEADIDEEAFYRQFFAEEQTEAMAEVSRGHISLETIEKYMQIEIPEEIKAANGGNIAARIDTRAFKMPAGSIYFALTKDVFKGNIIGRKKPTVAIGYPKYSRVFAKAEVPYVPCRHLRCYIADICRLWRGRLNSNGEASNTAIAVTGSRG